jgi:hypothetical protein
MGKQRLTPSIVGLIKHLKFNLGWNHYKITRETGFCSRAHVIKLVQEQRWSEVQTPTMEQGELLYWKWINNEI